MPLLPKSPPCRVGGGPSRAGLRPSGGGWRKSPGLTRWHTWKGMFTPEVPTSPWKQGRVFLKLFLVYFWRELGIRNQIRPLTGKNPACRPRICSNWEGLGRPGAVLVKCTWYHQANHEAGCPTTGHPDSRKEEELEGKRKKEKVFQIAKTYNSHRRPHHSYIF